MLRERRRIGTTARCALCARHTLATVVFLAACSRTGGGGAGAASSDSTFAALQRRGAQAMGVDQWTSMHVFEDLPDGGRVVLERDVPDDSAGVATIRAHMREIAADFGRGNFDTPGFVHARDVPGTAVMAAKRDAITYAPVDRPRGGELRITTRDPEAVSAVHAFLAFQRQDHRAAGHEGSGHAGHQQPAPAQPAPPR